MRTEIARVQEEYGTTTVYVTHDQTEAMTLGDRVAVLRRGVVQQVGSPRNLYNDPADLFVAGFIGSPSMNLLPGTVRDGKLELPFATIDLRSRTAERLGSAERHVIAGIRPEHVEDAELVSESDLDAGSVFPSRIDTIEWMGSELYAYLPYTTSGAGDATLEALAADLELEQRSGDESQLVARLDASSQVSEAGEARIWVDTRKLHLFDPETGESLTRRHTPEHPEVAAAATGGSAAG